ncbi:conserved hypothetical protein [Magnetococcus marinus MC-1]|uniref:Nickel transport complex, NikM subunit, transmembrane n=1 Tax=Magnetococcus marinus (strain ATCC BAA-1437 / JCM 17883 / MC-1) TaxID=156889 RepID=A0LCD8_MAGMM|nr:DUF4198 domain-containing protein [Magnetococcus marinus]ABK45631.1 conserved hypothetical protein [Magnetococcus marinus MC-1]
MSQSKKTANTLLLVLWTLLYSSGAQAHFQLLYTPEVNLSKAATLPIRLIFAHPLENGHVMSMARPQAFYYWHKDKREELLPALTEITWQGPSNGNTAFAAEVPIKRNGDYIFVVEPTPYFEPSEELYIQQLTKSFVNKGGLPSGWEQPLGLKAEIVPLNKPTAILVGSTFSGVVLSEGQPVVGAEIEIEWINGQPDLQANRFGASRVTPPASVLVAISDANGVFTFGIPRAGWWGFAALGVGPDKRYQGKALSQDAVLWISATELR